MNNNWEEEFDKKFPCITSGCDNNGVIPEQVSEDEWEPRQCQFCYEYRFPIKEFISKRESEIRKETIEAVLDVTKNRIQHQAIQAIKDLAKDKFNINL